MIRSPFALANGGAPGCAAPAASRQHGARSGMGKGGRTTPGGAAGPEHRSGLEIAAAK
jgi:hypothetical protein